jgi:hypothetical protein
LIPKFTKHFEVGKRQNFERSLEHVRHILLSNVYHTNIFKMKKRVEILILEHKEFRIWSNGFDVENEIES